MNFTLILSPVAAALMNANTRLRVKHTTRAGKKYIAVRPSFRCKKSNHMVRVVDITQADGTVVKGAHFNTKLMADSGAPEILDGEFYMRDVGYGWFLIEVIPDQADAAGLPVVDVVAFSGSEAEEDESDDSVEQAPKAESKSDSGRALQSVWMRAAPAMAPTTEMADAAESSTVVETEHASEPNTVVEQPTTLQETETQE